MCISEMNLQPIAWDVAFDPSRWPKIVAGTRYKREVLNPRYDTLLVGHSVFPRLMFRTREGKYHVALGSEHFVTNLEDADLQKGRYYGGQRFDPASSISDEWKVFGTSYWFLPRVEVKKSTIIINPTDDPSCTMDILRQLHTRCPSQLEIPRVISVSEPFKFADFEKAIKKIINDETLDKAVMARRVDMMMNSVHPLTLLQEVMAKSKDMGRYILFFMPTEDKCFFSLTPERLVKVRDKAVWSESLAGTFLRDEYEKYGESLLDQEKTTLEHKLVSDYLEVKLGQVTNSEVLKSERRIKKLTNIVHLKQVYETTVDVPVSWFLKNLSPTPAVCGVPLEPAKQFIIDHEPFDRGFYAGPCGYVDKDGAEMLVALRSALWDGTRNNLLVYAGAGIVQGSDAKEEWDEIYAKFCQFTLTFSLTDNLKESLMGLPNVNSVYARCIIEELVRQGVTHFIVCPGSRSTPLVCAIAQHPLCTSIVHNDERGACYHALGRCKAGSLCAIVVTSGTAVANLLPAIVEASLCVSVPGPIILSADRPMDLRLLGANQTLQDQSKLLPCVQWSKDIAAPPDPPLTSVLSDVGWAVSEASKGPVQINLQFRENLAPDGGPKRECPLGRTCEPEPDLLHGLDRWTRGNAPWARYRRSVGAGCAHDIQQILGVLSKCERVAVVIGQLLPEEVTIARYIALRLGHCIFADVTSGLRQCCLRADQLLSAIENKGLFDGCVLLGGAVTSKRMTNFPLNIIDGPVVRVLPRWMRFDPVLRCTHVLECSLNELVPYLGNELPQDELLQELSDTIGKKLDLGKELSEPWIAYTCSKLLRPHSALFCSSSMPIRDMDTFMCSDSNEAIPVAANRGASGIEGIINTAAGFCSGLKRPTVCIIGDIASIVDINALNNLNKELPKGAPLTIVIVNNSGGAIFSFLPIAKHAQVIFSAWSSFGVFSPYFESPNDTDFSSLVKGFGVEYRVATTQEAFATEFTNAQNMTRGVTVVEIRVPVSHSDNVKIHANLAKQVGGIVRLQLATALASKLAWMKVGPSASCPFVLLHGFLGRKEDWLQVVPEKTLSAYLFDLPGHGESGDHPLFFSFDILIEALSLVLDRLKIEKIHLCGYSLGGRIALHFRHRYPTRVASLTLIGTHLGLSSSSERAERIKDDDLVARKLESQELLDTFFESWYKAPLWAQWATRCPRSYQLMMASRRTLNVRGACRAVRGFSLGRAHPDIFPGNPSFPPGHFTFIVGALDTKFLTLARDAWAHSLPCSPSSPSTSPSSTSSSTSPCSSSLNNNETSRTMKLVVVPNCAHSVLFECPEAIQKELTRVLESFPPSVSPSSSSSSLHVSSTKSSTLGGGILESKPSLNMNNGVEVLAARVIKHEDFSLPLKEPLVLSRGTSITTREGVLIYVALGDAVGVGEICPLPGFHGESLEEAKRQIQEVPAEITTEWIRDADLLPSVRCGLEMALSHAFWRGDGDLPHFRRSCTRINSLLTRPETNSVENGVLTRQNNVCVKVKVGGNPIEDASKINKIIGAYPTSRLRVDANRSWTLEQTLLFLNHITDLGCIEYLEDPIALGDMDNVSLIEQWETVSQMVPVAVDESFAEGFVSVDCPIFSKFACTLILKPALLGYMRTQELLRWASESCKRVVLSSCFESSVSIAHYSLLAAQLEDDEVHGLSTFSRFERDIFQIKDLSTFAILEALDIVCADTSIARVVSAGNLMWASLRMK